MTIYLKEENRIITIDGREQAPASASVDMFKDPDSPTGENLPFIPNLISSGVAVGVPGTLLEWVELHSFSTGTDCRQLGAGTLSTAGIEYTALCDADAVGLFSGNPIR